jgi:antitoxin (DNA-binding transcriptional repressor) of toxin-antitoxin stability system
MMMKQYTLKDAQYQLKQLVQEAQSGQNIVILDENNHAVQLVPLAHMHDKQRRAGSARGKIRMSDDFDAPLADFEDYMPR